MRSEADVVVVGLGVLGAAAVAALARQGLTVVGLDERVPPHPFGSSHGRTRIIRRVYIEGSAYVPLVDRAYELWRALERDTGSPLLQVRGGLSVGPAEGELVRAALACAVEADLEHELLDAGAVEQRHPGLRLPGDSLAVFDPAAGLLLAEPCLEALLAVAAAAGAELRPGCAVHGWRVADDGVEIDSAAGMVRARWLVLATGAWLSREPAATGLGLTVERQVQHWFDPPPGAGRSTDLPPFVWQLEDGRTWYGLPDLGQGLKVGLHHGGARAGVETVRRSVAVAEVEEMRRVLARHLPAAAGSCVDSHVCLYTNTPDLRFLAGPLPGEPRVWLLGGGSGHAFKFAPALAELLARGLARARPPAALAPFLPVRFASA